jgi:hypothetical protein
LLHSVRNDGGSYGYRPCEELQDDDAQPRSVQDAIQTVVPVIANPEGEAIHACTLDCFPLRVRG